MKRDPERPGRSENNPEPWARWSDAETRGYLPRLMREAREAEQAAHEARARLTRAAARLRERGAA